MEGATIVVLYFWRKHDGQTAKAAVSCPQSATVLLNLQYKSLPRRERAGFETLTQHSLVWSLHRLCQPGCPKFLTTALMELTSSVTKRILYR
jgi:hypothetical protein